MQDKAIREYHLLIWNRYLKDYKKYEGHEINGIVLTKAAMVSCAHLVGQNIMKKFIDSNGRIDGKDGNGVSCSKYMREFGDYELDLSKNKNDNQKSKKEESNNEGLNLINSLFKYFNTPEIQDEGINNLQRFKVLQDKAKAEGDEEFVGIFGNLAESHKQVFDFLDNLNQREDL